MKAERPSWLDVDLLHRFRRGSPVYCILLAASLTGTPVEGEEGPYKFSTGMDYSTGNYGDAETTTMYYFPFSAGYKRGNWAGKMTLAWLAIDGPGTVVGGGDGGVVLPPGGGETSTESGVGDIWLSVTYEVPIVPYQFGYVDLVGKLKIPMADEDKRLGTGEFDETLQLDYMYAWNRLTPMLTVAYKIKGDPDGYELKDVFYISGGADWRQTDDLHVGLTLDYQQASTDGAEDPLEFFGYGSYKVHPKWSVLPYGYVGLSDGSPDYGGGLQVTYKP